MDETRDKKELLELLLYHSYCELGKSTLNPRIEAGLCALLNKLQYNEVINGEEYVIISDYIQDWVDANNEGRLHNLMYLFNAFDWKPRVAHIESIIKEL